MWAPLGAVNHTAAWHPEPTTRGTWSILSTCLSTIILCIWTALHLNIPEYNNAQGQRQRKATLVIIGLFAPELIVYIAFQQWRTQRALQKCVGLALEEFQLPQQLEASWTRRFSRLFNHNKKADEEINLPSLNIDGNPTQLRDRWKQAHSFFATMGGFAFERGNASGDLLFPNKTRLTLSPKAIAFIAKHKPELINIPESTIKDKSKSNGVTKLLAFWQGLSFCIQFVSRLTNGLSISLLELCTFAHVIYASLVYFVFWWHKPLDIQEPHLIPTTDESTQLLCAIMCKTSSAAMFPCKVESSKTDTYLRRVALALTSSLDYSKAKAIILTEPSVEIVPSNKILSPLNNIHIPETNQNQTSASQYRDAHRHSQRHLLNTETTEYHEVVPSPPFGEPDAFKLGLGQTKFGLSFPKISIDGIDVNTIQEPSKIYIEISQEIKRMLLLCHQASQEYSTSLDDIWWRQFQYDDFLIHRASNKPSNWLHSRRIHLMWHEKFRNNHQNTNLPTTESLSQNSSDISSSIGSRLSDDYKKTFSSFEYFCIGFCGVSFLYGGMHLLFAWDAPINTTTELILWRISCITLLAPWGLVIGYTIAMLASMIVVLGLGIVVKIIVIVLNLSGLTLSSGWTKKVRNSRFLKWIRSTTWHLAICGSFIFAIPLYSFCLLYFFSRVYLVVECFISLPYASESVFVQPVWSTYLPHLGA